MFHRGRAEDRHSRGGTAQAVAHVLFWFIDRTGEGLGAFVVSAFDAREHPARLVHVGAGDGAALARCFGWKAAECAATAVSEAAATLTLAQRSADKRLLAASAAVGAGRTAAAVPRKKSIPARRGIIPVVGSALLGAGLLGYARRLYTRGGRPRPLTVVPRAALLAVSAVCAARREPCQVVPVLLGGVPAVMVSALAQDRRLYRGTDISSGGIIHAGNLLLVGEAATLFRAVVGEKPGAGSRAAAALGRETQVLATMLVDDALSSPRS